MKKTLLILFSLLPIYIFAQSSHQEHLRIMGVPICGSVDEMCSNLIQARGLTDLHKDPGYLNSTANTLRGNFWQFDNCDIDVIKRNNKSEVGLVIVSREDYTSVQGIVDELISTYTDKYGTPRRFQEIPGNVYSSIKYEFLLDNGTITVEIVKVINNFKIIYSDYTECSDYLNRSSKASDDL